MTNSNEGPTPRPRSGRLFWIAGLALGLAAGAFVAFELTVFGG
jgi:hypothetical protein